MRDAPSNPLELQLAELERLIRRDPARRGLIDSEATRGPLCPGHLAAAADHLARFGTHVNIVTGFFIPGANPPSAETDGPPGAALLTAVLLKCGIQARLITDEFCESAVTVAGREYGLPSDAIIIWRREQPSFSTNSLSHLISIERVGPSHSLAGYAGLRELSHPAVQRFRQLVPREHEDRCHNMRGEIIDDFSPPLYHLFEVVSREHPGVRTIGIGDGGNEIGMGSIAWDELQSRLSGPNAAAVPCRIATDWTIVAGVSNWGAQALAAAVCLLRGCGDFLADFDLVSEERRLNAIVQNGPAVDGITRLREATVDGLPFLTYIQPWEAMRRKIFSR